MAPVTVSVRPTELAHSQAFRLAFFYTALFGISVAVLFGFIYWTASRYLTGHVDEFVFSEAAMLEADFEVDGPQGVIGLMRERTAADASGRWIYLYLDAAGRKLAGNIDEWPTVPAGRDGFWTLPGRPPDEPNRIRARAVALRDGGRILIGLDDYEVTEMREALARAIWLGMGLMLLLAIGGGILVARASQRQLEAINRVIHDIMQGDLRQRVPVTDRDDEFDTLGRSINAMLDRIGVLMQAVKGVTDNIAHDLRLPLARHRVRLETAVAQSPGPADLQEILTRSIKDVDSILSTFGALLHIANIESGMPRETFVDVDLTSLVRDAEEFFEPMASLRKLEFAATSPPRLVVRGNRDLLFQALSNVVDNAIKFTPPGARVELRLSRRDRTAELLVADGGPGIPPSERQKVFQRFYRLDASRHTAGSGLGLSLVRAVVLLHEGSCEIEDNHPGSRVVIQLPCDS